jgi:hypothetical protein
MFKKDQKRKVPDSERGQVTIQNVPAFLLKTLRILEVIFTSIFESSLILLF